MPLTAEASRLAIAELIGPRVDVVRRRLLALDERDWSSVIAGGARHRVLPLMHWRTREAGVAPLAGAAGAAGASGVAGAAGAAAHAAIPADIAARLQTEMLASTQQVLVALAAARRIDEVLADAGVPALFLKGVHLAASVYPQAGLRPMRDIDVLVPEERADDALAALERAGAARESGKDGDLDAWRAGMHHLPALVMPGRGVRVEVHTSLSPREQVSAAGVRDIPDWDQLWPRAASIECAGRTVRVLSPEDLLVHLVVHAVYHHRLSNGPLALADVGFLLARHRIDWAAVWRAAEQQGIVRGCVLLLRLLEREWGPEPVEWHGRGASVDDEVLQSASMLLLQESQRPGHLVIAKASRGVGGAVRLALQRIFMPRRDLALMYPVKADSLAAFAWYPRHWWRLVTRRLPEYLRYRRQTGVNLDLQAMDSFERWLRG